ncbi:MAG: fumarylacetoacetate hydrolase family protein [Clostridiaceae bacterium]
MKFLTYHYQNEQSIGILSKNEQFVIEISHILNGKRFEQMVDFIKTVTEEELRVIKEFTLNQGEFTEAPSHYIPLPLVKVCSPIERPIHDIICIGVNYEAHLDESKKAFGSDRFKETVSAVYFSKRASKIMGPEDFIEGRFDLDEDLDYEVELAVIIGKEGINIPKDQVEDHIFGYTILNDLSQRTLQRKHNQWYRGKSLDTHTAMGPVILHKSAVDFPVELDIECSVNGEVRQKANTRLLIHDIKELISEFSEGILLEPGDIIATGTPAGVGMSYTPKRYLKKGDEVCCRIQGIGELNNRIK